MTIQTPMLLVFASKKACGQADDAMKAIRAKLDANSQHAVYEWREQKNCDALVREMAQCPAVNVHVTAEVYYIIDGDTDMERLADVHRGLKNAFDPLLTTRYGALWLFDGYGAAGQREMKQALAKLGLDHIVLISNLDERGNLLPWNRYELAALAALAVNQKGRVDDQWLCTGYNRMGKPEKELTQRLRHTAMEYICAESAKPVEESLLYSTGFESAVCGSQGSGAQERNLKKLMEDQFFKGFPSAEEATAIPRDTRDETLLRAYADAFIRENADIKCAQRRVDAEIERCRTAVLEAIRSEIHIESTIKLFGKEGYFTKNVIDSLRGGDVTNSSFNDRRGLERMASYQNRILCAQAGIALKRVKAQIMDYAVKGYDTLREDFEREAKACLERREAVRKDICLSDNELQMNRAQTARYDEALATPAAQKAALENRLSGVLWPEDSKACDELWTKKCESAAEAIRGTDRIFTDPFWGLIQYDSVTVNRYAGNVKQGVLPMLFRYVPQKTPLGWPWCWYPDCLNGVLDKSEMQFSDVKEDNLEILQLYALKKAQGEEDQRDIPELLDDIPAFRVIEGEKMRTQAAKPAGDNAPHTAAPQTEAHDEDEGGTFSVRAVRENDRVMLYWEWKVSQSAMATIRCTTDYDEKPKTSECTHGQWYNAGGCDITSLIRPGHNHITVELNDKGSRTSADAKVTGKKREVSYCIKKELLGASLKDGSDRLRLNVYKLNVYFGDDASTVTERLRLKKDNFVYPLNDGSYDSRRECYLFRNICAEGGSHLRVVARPDAEDEMNITER